MINQGDEEQDFQQDEPDAGSEVDYRSEYEKAVAENATWRDKYARRDAEYRSQHGQLAPAQKELARLKALVDSQKKDETPNEWKSFEESFPDEAKAHNARLTPLQRKLEEIERRNNELEQRYTDRDREYTQKERFRNVLDKHPDFPAIMGSKEFQEFGLRLPKALRQAFENREDPDDEVHIHVLDLFKDKYANSRPSNSKRDYVQSQGIAPKAKQIQGSSYANDSSDPEEQAFMRALSHAKKIRSK